MPFTPPFWSAFSNVAAPIATAEPGEKHGPFFYLSRCLPKRQMRTLLLKEQSQILQARHGVEAYQQLLESLDQLSWINWELLRRGDPLQAE